MIFTRDQAAQVRAGKISAALVPVSEQVTAGRLRALRRRFVRHDEDGNPTGEGVETVADVTPEGDRRPVRLTILSVHDMHLDDLAQPDARACGYTTRQGLLDAWRSQHPRSETVKLVRFAVGDVRDRDRYLAWTGRAGGDYTANPRRAMDDAAALTEEQLEPLVRRARELDRARRRGAAAEAETLSLEARLRRLEAQRRSQRVDISRELRVIAARIERAERQLDDEAA